MTAMVNSKTKAYLPVLPIGRCADLIDSINWKKYSVEQWLEQYGAWVNEGGGGCGIGYHIPHSAAMHVSKGEPPPPRLVRVTCNITDDEARAVMRLLVELGGFDAKVIVYKFEHQFSLRDMRDEFNCSIALITSCINSGMAWICGRAGMFRGHEDGK